MSEESDKTSNDSGEGELSDHLDPQSIDQKISGEETQLKYGAKSKDFHAENYKSELMKKLEKENAELMARNEQLLKENQKLKGEFLIAKRNNRRK